MPLLAQGGNAQLSGSVRDASGLPVEGARIEAKQQATNAVFQTASDRLGDYRLAGLPLGPYELSIEKPGFRTYRRTGISLYIGDQISLNAALEIGPAAQSVDVNEQTLLLHTGSGAVDFGASEKEIVSLPLDGRNFIPLVALSPGVALPNGSLLPFGRKRSVTIFCIGTWM